MWRSVISDDRRLPIHFTLVNNMLVLTQLLFLTLFCANLPAHGIIHRELRDGQGIQVSYDNNDPMAFADVQIFRPGESELEFQTGLSDENGVFMFKPDTLGYWTVKVSDGLGHGQVFQILVDDISETTPGVLSLSRREKLISGLGYILFLFSVWYFFIERKRNRHAHS